MAVLCQAFECGGRTWWPGQRVRWNYAGGLDGVVAGLSLRWCNVVLVRLDPARLLDHLADINVKELSPVIVTDLEPLP